MVNPYPHHRSLFIELGTEADGGIQDMAEELQNIIKMSTWELKTLRQPNEE
jgi:hypothetical protein